MKTKTTETTAEAEGKASRKGKAKKTSGERKVRDSSLKTQEIILDAALGEFSKKTYDAARVDEIALISGLNKNVIYHHFSSKDQLFAAVLERTYNEIQKSHSEINLRDMPPVEGMRKLVIATGQMWLRHPQYQQMIRCENLLEGRHVKSPDNNSKRYDPLLESLSDLLQRGVDEGVFRDGVNAVDLYISISALTAHYINNRYTLETNFHENLMAPNRIKQRLKHAADMVLMYIVK